MIDKNKLIDIQDTIYTLIEDKNKLIDIYDTIYTLIE